MESKGKEVNMSIKFCIKCGSPFRAEHGNSKHCPGKDCSEIAKLERQSKKYIIGNDAKKAIQKNHKIFSDLLGNIKSSEFELTTILKMGFVQNGFYGSYITKETQMRCYNVHDFYFHITAGNPQKIQIWKA